jgi:hypothetical protein
MVEVKVLLAVRSVKYGPPSPTASSTRCAFVGPCLADKPCGSKYWHPPTSIWSVEGWHTAQHTPMAMAMAPVVYCLWQRFLRFDPEDPIWPNRYCRDAASEELRRS